MARMSASNAGMRLGSELRDVTLSVQRELIRVGVLPGPETGSWCIQDADLGMYRDCPEHRQAAVVLRAGLRVQLLAPELVDSIALNQTRQGLLAMSQMMAAARVLEAPVTPREVPWLELAVRYRPKRHFCFELRRSGFELKAIAMLVSETPIELGWQRVQQWLREDANDLERFAKLARAMLPREK